MSLVSNFWEVSDQFHAEQAFIDTKRSVSFAEFKNQVKCYAAALQNMGLQKGDAILLAIPVSIEFYVHLIAAWYLGVRVVITADIKNKAKTKKLCKEVEVRRVLTTRKLYWLKYLFLPKSLWQMTKTVRPQNKIKTEAADLGSNSVLLITTTSGTTGDFKIAFRTQEFLLKQFDTIQEILETKKGEVHLSSFPVVLLCNLLVGVTSAILPKGPIPNFVKKLSLNNKLQLISASPYYMQALQKEIDFSLVDHLIVGGASLFKSLADTLKPWAHKTKLIYGSMEVEPISVARLSSFGKSEAEEVGIYVGKMHDQLSVKILNPTGEIGEIAVSGAHVLLKEFLLRGAHLYQRIDGSSFYKTGDLGYLKNDQLYFYGRKKYAWLYKGKLYSPVLCEKWNAEQGIFAEATMLQIGEQHVVFYTGSKDAEIKFKRHAPFEVNLFVQTKCLPKDKRHQSRIMYEELKKRIV